MEGYRPNGPIEGMSTVALSVRDLDLLTDALDELVSQQLLADWNEQSINDLRELHDRLRQFVIFAP